MSSVEEVKNKLWFGLVRIGSSVTHAINVSKTSLTSERAAEEPVATKTDHKCSDDDQCFPTFIEPQLLRSHEGCLDLTDLPVVCNRGIEIALLNVPEPTAVQSLIIRNKKYFTQVPEAVGRFSHALSLDFSGNQLEDLPWTMAYLQALHTVDLSQNIFSSFPINLSFCTNLQILLLSYNFIEQLPNIVLTFNKLRVLDLAYNPMVSPDVRVCKKGPQHIFKAISLRQDQNENRFDEWLMRTNSYDASNPVITTLAELSLHSVLSQPYTDFLTCPHVPVAVKRFLNLREKSEKTGVELKKCSVCSHRFSNKLNFESHECAIK